MQLYLVRHGETKWNRERRYYGATDIPLNLYGIEQARQVGEKLKKICFDQIYLSPLIRTRQTLNYMYEDIQEKKLRIEERKQLVEQSLGKFEGYTYGELEQKFPEELCHWNHHWKDGAPEGESYQQLCDRVLEFCQKDLELVGIEYGSQETISCKKKEKMQEKILIISHEAVFRCFCTLVLKMNIDAVWNFTFTQGAYSRIDIEDGVAIIRTINQM